MHSHSHTNQQTKTQPGVNPPEPEHTTRTPTELSAYINDFVVMLEFVPERHAEIYCK